LLAEANSLIWPMAGGKNLRFLKLRYTSGPPSYSVRVLSLLCTKHKKMKTWLNATVPKIAMHVSHNLRYTDIRYGKKSTGHQSSPIRSIQYLNNRSHGQKNHRVTPGSVEIFSLGTLKKFDKNLTSAQLEGELS
jgi:hypothetical protein